MAAVLVASACDDPGDAVPDASTSRFIEADSAQVVIRTTHWSADDAMSTRAIAPEPTLLLGSDTLPGQAFFRVRGAVTSGDGGGVAVLDAGSGELRFFDAGGDFLGAYGGYGEGPEEFQDPYLVRGQDPDTVLVFDSDLRRLHWIAADRSGSRSISIRDWVSRQAPVGEVAGHFLQPRALPSLTRVEQGLGTKDVSFRWVSATTGPKEFELLNTPTSYVPEVVPGRPAIAYAYPFANSNPLAAVWGETAVTYGGESELRQHAIDGTLVASVRVEGLRVELTQATVELAARQRTTDPQRREFYRDFYSAMPLPDSLPLYSELVSGSGNRLWARLFAHDLDSGGGSRWIVFSPEGEALGSVEFPPGTDLLFAGEGHVLLLHTDSLDVERVGRHEFRPGDLMAPAGRP